MPEVLRIANCSGFFGDRLAAPREMVEGGPIDVLTGDYLAELTMLILWKSRQRDPSLGFARTFYRQMEDVLGTCVDRGIKVVANAGGLNPAGLADQACASSRPSSASTPRWPMWRATTSSTGSASLQAAGDPLAHLDTGRPLAEAGQRARERQRLSGRVRPIAEALAGGADVVV